MTLVTKSSYVDCAFLALDSGSDVLENRSSSTDLSHSVRHHLSHT